MKISRSFDCCAPALRFALILCAASFLALAGARGGLIFADSFDYPQGDLVGNGPPPGSPPGQGGWRAANGEPRASVTGLQFPGIFSAGGSAGVLGIDGTNGDKTLASLGPVTADDGEVWVGFLIRLAHSATAPDGFAVVSLGNDVTDPSLGIGLLFEKHRYGLDNNTGVRHSRAVTPFVPSPEIVWMVTKLDFMNGQEYLWINPATDVEPDITEADGQLPMTADFLASGFSEIALKIGYNAALFQFDELRVGTEFADVVNPVAH